MNHPQHGPTKIKTDNSTSVGYVNNNMQMKKSKTWDMQLHWLRDKELHKDFSVYWDKGSENGADYFTKHHTITHHRKSRHKYIRDEFSSLQHKFFSIFHLSSS